MLTFVEAAKQTQNELEQGVIELYRNHSPILNYMAFQNIQGDSKTWNIENTLPGVGNRAVNEDWTESEGSVDTKTASIKIFGGRAKVDRFIQRTQGNGTDLLAQQIEKKSKAAALYYTKEFFKGDSSVNTEGVDGLDVLFDGGLGNVLDMGTAALTLKKLDELIDSVQGDPSCLFMSKAMRRIVNDLVRAEGQAIETVSDQFGRRLNAYAGIPIEVVEVDNQYNQILGFDETDSTASIYAVRFGSDGCHGFQNGALSVEKPENVGVWVARDIEWYASGPIMRHPDCASRLKGITAA